MKKMLLLLSVGLLWASLASAQDATAGQSAPPSSTAASAGAIQGCVSGSDGKFMLTQDDTGTTYKLVGNEDQVKNHVDHEVAVTGQVTGGAGSAASGSDQGQPASGNSAGASIQVTEVKMIATKCSSGGSTPQSH